MSCPTAARSRRWRLRPLRHRGGQGFRVLGWLDGLSEGEQRYEELCRVAIAGGVEAISCIPDLRYASPKGAEPLKLVDMSRLFELADRLGLPMVTGTEMNIRGSGSSTTLGIEGTRPAPAVAPERVHLLRTHGSAAGGGAGLHQRVGAEAVRRPHREERFRGDRQAGDAELRSALRGLTGDAAKSDCLPLPVVLRRVIAQAI